MSRDMNSIFTTILHGVRRELKISNNDYVYLDAVYRLSRGRPCTLAADTLAYQVGVTRRTLQRMHQRLESQGLVTRIDEKRQTTPKWEKIAYFERGNYEKTKN